MAETMEEYVRTTDLATDDKHRLLSAGRRRLALALLSERRNVVELEELATAIARRETDSETVDEETVKQITILLHHRHLPMMDDLDVVDYDADLRQVDPDGIPHISHDGQPEW